MHTMMKGGPKMIKRWSRSSRCADNHTSSSRHIASQSHCNLYDFEEAFFVYSIHIIQPLLLKIILM